MVHNELLLAQGLTIASKKATSKLRLPIQTSHLIGQSGESSMKEEDTSQGRDDGAQPISKEHNRARNIDRPAVRTAMRTSECSIESRRELIIRTSAVRCGLQNEVKDCNHMERLGA